MKLVQTCEACPEQYDVVLDSGKIVGYLRLRWSHFTVEYLPTGGLNGDEELVYEATIDDTGWSGGFSTEAQRCEHLGRALAALCERMAHP